MQPWKRVRTSVLLMLLSSVGLAGCQVASGDPVPIPSNEVTAPTTNERAVRFTAAGDAGMGEGANAVLDKIRKLAPDFNVHLGDISYRNNAEQEFCAMVSKKLGPDFPYQLIAGNHESNGSDGHIDKFAACLPNKLPGLQGEYGKQWYVDVPQEQPLVRVILVSPDLEFRGGALDYSEGSESWRWTEAAIDGARSAEIPWTVVGMHKLCFSMGNYGCDAGEALTNLLISKNVDLVLTGHEHVYQRTHQLGMSNDCPFVAAETGKNECVVDSDNAMISGKGTVFTTVGVGGEGTKWVKDEDPEKPYFAAWSGSNKDPALGTLHVTATSTWMDVRFAPASGYTFTDAFTIKK